MASVQAENVVGVAEVIDADVAVVSGFKVLLRLIADHGVCPPVVSFAFCWAHISSAKGMSGTSKHTEEEGDTGGSGQSLIMLQSEAIFHAVTAIGSFLSSLSPHLIVDAITSSGSSSCLRSFRHIQIVFHQTAQSHSSHKTFG